jgi:hypothetical protein
LVEFRFGFDFKLVFGVVGGAVVVVAVVVVVTPPTPPTPPPPTLPPSVTAGAAPLVVSLAVSASVTLVDASSLT